MQTKNAGVYTRNIEDIVALTPLQAGMLFHYLKDASSDSYFEQICLEINGPLDLPSFRNAWQYVVGVNEILRTCFSWQTVKNPIQIILKNHQPTVVYRDFTSDFTVDYKGGSIPEQLNRLKRDDRENKFNLQNVPFRVTLCKTGEEAYTIIISHHHILYDGWSTGIILTEFFTAYGAYCKGETPETPSKNQFKSFVKYLQVLDKKKPEQFWHQYLQNYEFDSGAPLTGKNGRIVDDDTTGVGINQVSLSKDLTNRLGKLVKTNNITLASFIYGCWGILLQKYRDTPDVVFGTTVSGRSAGIKGIENMVGLFINTVPLRVMSGQDTSAFDQINEINRMLMERQAYENTALTDIQTYCGMDAGETLFDSIVVLENYPLDKSNLNTASTLTVNAFSVKETSHYPLALSIIPGEKMEMTIGFKYSLYDDDSVSRLGIHWLSILETVINQPEIPVAHINIVSEEERKQQLITFNDTSIPYPTDKTIHSLFEEMVSRNPDASAVTGSEHTITYRELDRQSNQLARILNSRGMGTGSIVALLTQRSIEMLVGIMGILKSGGAYLPIEPGFPPERIAFMLKDANAQLMVCQQSLWEPLSVLSTEITNRCEPVYIDRYDESTYDLVSAHEPKKNEPIAYIIYTSGTTGKPKGVLNTHANVVRVVRNTNYIDINRNDRLLQLSNYAFDGSVFDIFGAFLNGATLVILPGPSLPPLESLPEVIRREKITVFFVTTSLFNALTDVDPGVFKQVRKVLLGGERASKDHTSRAFAANGKGKIINAYGPTETTVFATYHPVDSINKDAVTIPIGKPIANTTIYILSRSRQLLPQGAVGEIYIGGRGVALGYMNRPELTARRFIHWSDGTGNQLLYRTGDLGRFLPDGAVEFIGRFDQQVKIRGFRIEPQEIAAHLLENEAVKEALVTVREEKSEKYLCAYVVPTTPDAFSDGPDMENRLIDFLKGKLPDYMIPSFFVPMVSLPLTSNGKIDKKALPVPDVAGTATYTAPEGEKEKQLVEIWASLLGIPAKDIGAYADFFRLGGHSLKATILSARIRKQLNIEIPVADIFKYPTLREMARYINGMDIDTASTGEYRDITKADEKKYYPLTGLQKSFYLMHHVDAGSTNLNLSLAVPLDALFPSQLSTELITDTGRLPGQLMGKLNEIFRILIHRHESFRTSFLMVDGEVFQQVHSEVTFDIEYYQTGAAGFLRPFDLSVAPLLRAGLLRTGENKYLLLMDMHHIICDGTSQDINLRELSALLTDQSLPQVPVQFRDFAQWRQERVDSGTMREHEEYWLRQLSGELPLLNLPTDFPRPTPKRYDGHSFSFPLGQVLTQRLHKRLAESGATLYMMMLAVYTLLLGKISGEKDIIIGSPVSGRVHDQLQHTVGPVMNALLMRNRWQENESFEDFLQRVKETASTAFKYQEYPLEDLLTKLQYRESSDRNPVTDIALNVINMFDDALVRRITAGKAGNTDDHCDRKSTGNDMFQRKASKVDITLTAMETAEEVICILEYCTALFKPQTMDYFAERFRYLLEQVLENPGIELSHLDIISPMEKRAVIGEDVPCYPLSHPQKRIYDTEKTFADTGCNTVVYTIRYKEPLDDRCLETAIHMVIQNNEALRLRVVRFPQTPEPLQYVSLYQPQPLERLDFNGPEGEMLLARFLEKEIGEFPALENHRLFRFALVRFSANEWGYFMKLHHIVCDGWTVTMLFDQVDAYYRELLTGGCVEDVLPSYIDFIAEEKQYLESAESLNDKVFWHNTLLPLPQDADLSTKRGNPLNVAGSVEKLPFPPQLRDRMHTYCKESRASIFKLILCALYIYISRVTGNDDIVIGGAAYNRHNDAQKKTAGMFAATIPFRVTADGETAFADLVCNVGNDINHIAKSHQRYPYDLLLEELRQESGFDPGYLLNVNLIGHGSFDQKPFKMIHHFPGYEPTPLCIHINVDNKDITGILEMEWDFQVERFDVEDIRRIHRGLVNILEETLADPGKSIDAVELLSRDEREQVLHTFNEKADDTGEPVLLQSGFEKQAALTPDDIAVVGRSYVNGVNGVGDDAPMLRVTYSELNQWAEGIAAILREKGVQPGAIVALLVAPTIDMIAGILGILKAGGAYLPIDPVYPEHRIQYMLEDSDTQILLTTQEFTLPSGVFNGERLYFEKSTRKEPDACIVAHVVNGPTIKPVRDRRRAYVIYTSGSTGKPKGVVVSHANASAYLNAFAREFQLTQTDTVVQQASYAFDAFVEEMYPVLAAGGRLVMTPKAIVRDIGRLAEFIQAYRVTFITCSPLMLDQLNKLDPIDPISSIRIFISGGDVLKGEYITNLLKIGRVYNTYGPTETTVCAAYYRCPDDCPPEVPIGKPIAGYSAYVLDSLQRLLPVGVPGELWVGGDGVALGYLNNPELTAHRFIHQSHPSHMSYRSHPSHYYRTGDRVKWLPDGNIAFLGRVDEQVNIRGYRIEPGEIATRLETHDNVAQSVVVPMTDEHGLPQHLCAYVVPVEPIDSAALKKHLAADLPECMIPAFIIPIETIPLTPNGKVDKKQLPDPRRFMEDPGHLLPVTSELEQKLAALWSDILGIQPDRIGRESNFFNLGGHSLTAVEMVSKVEKFHHVKIPLADVFGNPTLAALARAINTAAKSKFAAIEPAPEQGNYPLTTAQRQVYIAQQMDPSNTGYNMPTALLLEGPLDKTHLVETFTQLIRRHDSLRTSFQASIDGVVQVIHETVPFEIQEIPATAEPVRDFIEPFPLADAPLIRVGLVQKAENRHLLMVDMHHIICDGISMNIIVRESLALYRGENLPPLPVRYRDFACWQETFLESAGGKAMETFWLDSFPGQVPLLDLPLDFPRPQIRGFEGGEVDMELGAAETSGLKQLASDEGVSLFMLLLALYNVLLARLARQDDIVVGSPSAGRRHADLENCVGIFLNTLPLRHFPRNEKTFRFFLGEVKENTLKAFENQDYPFDRLVEKLELPRNNRNPLFDVMFVFQNMEMTQVEVPGLTVTPYDPGHKQSKFDLTLTVRETADMEKMENTLSLRFTYYTGIFNEQSIRRFCDYFIRLTTSVLENPDIKLGDIDMVDDVIVDDMVSDFMDDLEDE